MFSKRLLQSALSFLIAVSLGCGLKLGEENNTARVAEVKGVSCLNNAIDDLKLFFTGDASDEQVGAAAECLQQVILTFKDNIRGKNKDSYTPGELASFLQNNFIKDGTKFTPELLAEVMKFKVLLFGGSTKVIEKTEIVAISSFIARFKPELVRLNPHMKVIVSKWTPETDAAAKENRFNAAKNAFKQLLVVFGKYIAATERSYEVGDLTTLLQELVKFTNKKSDVITTIENLKLFLLKTKLILIGGTSAITGQEWVTFHHTLAELYFQTLRINYFVTPLTPEQSDEKWLAYHRIADDITMLIPELLKAKGSDLLQNSDIAELLESIKAFAPALEINFELVNQVGKLKLVLLGKFF